jgi:RNA polymerase sigma factor (sigma-70 family)
MMGAVSMVNTERMMRVNSLAVKAKTDRSLILELFELVEPWIKAICRRYCKSATATRIFEFDDLCQSAFIGFLKAIDAYDPDRGAFSTILAWNVRHTCRSEIGLRGKRDPLHDALSLNKPLSETEDSLDHIDMLEDPGAENLFEEVTDTIYNSQLRSILDECMAEIPWEHADILRTRFYDGVKYKDLALKLGVSKVGAQQAVDRALKKMKKPVSASKFGNYRKMVISCSYGRGKTSYQLFHETWYSCVEQAAEALVLRDGRWGVYGE